MQDDDIEFYKKKPTDKIFWVRHSDRKGRLEFTFDKLTIYNAWKDYPKNLSANQREIFDKENPYWADFFKDRSE